MSSTAVKSGTHHYHAETCNRIEKFCFIFSARQMVLSEKVKRQNGQTLTNTGINFFSCTLRFTEGGEENSNTHWQNTSFCNVGEEKEGYSEVELASNDGKKEWNKIRWGASEQNHFRLLALNLHKHWQTNCHRLTNRMFDCLNCTAVFSHSCRAAAVVQCTFVNVVAHTVMLFTCSISIRNFRSTQFGNSENCPKAFDDEGDVIPLSIFHGHWYSLKRQRHHWQKELHKGESCS